MQITKEEDIIEIPKEKWDKLPQVSEAEWARFVLRGLISYHERMTMFQHPELDCWKEGLKFALACVEEKIQQ